MGSSKGMTLVELLVVLLVGSILTAAMFGAFINQQKSYAIQDQVVDMQQTLRGAIDRMTRRDSYGRIRRKKPCDFWKRQFFYPDYYSGPMRQIAQTNKMNDLEIRRIVYGLLQAGLVEIIRPEGTGPLISAKMFGTADKKEQRSLVNKLIGRTRTL